MKINPDAMLPQTRYPVEAETTRLCLTADENHGTRRRLEIRFVNPMTLFFFHDDRRYIDYQIFVARAFTQE